VVGGMTTTLLHLFNFFYLVLSVVVAILTPLLLGGSKSHCDCRNDLTNEMLWCSN
jgi:hypothetical protein